MVIKKIHKSFERLRINNLLLIFSLGLTQQCKTQERLFGVSFFSPRSQSTNAARELVGWHPYIHRYDIDSWYTVFATTPQYSKSVRPERIAQALFGTDSLLISGSQIINRNENAILADYFGLSPEFQSCVKLDPYIQNGYITFDAYIGLNNILNGLYVQIQAPYVWTKWDLQLCETVFNDGSNTPFPALYMAADEVIPPVDSFICAIQGGFTFGQMTEPLAFGRICGSQTRNSFSDIQVAVGWDFVLRRTSHAGFNIRFSAPTGTRPNSRILFEPVIGNGKHWELGLGFSGHVLLWEKDGEQEFSLFGDINFTHLFNARQCRSFDLNGECKCSKSMFDNGFGSRYILVKEFDEIGNYIGRITPLINKTTLNCDVSVDLQFDIALMFGYTYRGLVVDLGYNGWIRSKERIFLNECLPEKRFGLKGIQNVTTAANQLSILTQSTATLMGNEFTNQALVADPNSPVFITNCDLDLGSAASPRLVTHKFFGHLGYGWNDLDTLVPFIGIGGEIEFEGINTRNTTQPFRNTLSQWSVWLKSGITF